MEASFGTVIEAVAARLPDAVAVSEPGRDLTYAEFDDRAARLATALEAAGVGPGQTVACYLDNSSAYLETVLAAFKLGAVPVNVNYRYTADELTSLLTDADAAAVVFSGRLAPNVRHAAEHLRTLRLLVRAGEETDGAGPQAPELEELLRTTPPRPAAPRPGTDQLFMYTGGTTGRPKGVIWQQRDLLHSLAVPVYRPLGADLPADLEEAVAVAVRVHAEGRAPSTMPVVPLMHGTGLFNTLGALLVGGRAVLARPGRLDPHHVWDVVGQQRVGTVIVAGNAVGRPLADELTRAAQAGAPHDASSLSVVISSGTALSDGVKAVLHEHTPATVIDAIASSEGGPFAFAVTRSSTDLPSRFYPVPATRVIGSGGQLLAPGTGEVGVLGYSGPMPLGYYKDSAGTAATFRTVGGVRYVIPGDLASLEADGAIRFLGRGSGVINTGGEKVHPQEVEDVLLAHPDVTDAVVVGLPDETWGERVAAAVATREDRPGLVEELQDWVRRSLAGYKVPRVLLRVEELPRTPTGKLEVAWARRALAALDEQARPGRS